MYVSGHVTCATCILRMPVDRIGVVYNLKALTFFNLLKKFMSHSCVKVGVFLKNSEKLHFSENSQF